MLLCFSVALNAKEAYTSPELQFSTWSLCANSLIALVACLSILLAPIWLICALNKYWYPEYIRSIDYKVSTRKADKEYLDSVTNPEKASSETKNARTAVVALY